MRRVERTASSVAGTPYWTGPGTEVLRPEWQDFRVRTGPRLVLGLFLLFSFNPRKQAFQAVQWRVPFRIEHLLQVFHGVGDVTDGFWQDGAGGVRVAATLEFFRHLERLAVAAAKAGKHEVPTPEQRHQHRIFRRLPFE